MEGSLLSQMQEAVISSKCPWECPETLACHGHVKVTVCFCGRTRMKKGRVGGVALEGDHQGLQGEEVGFYLRDMGSHWKEGDLRILFNY